MVRMVFHLPLRQTERKLHLATDAVTGMIVAATLTENDKGDSSQVEPLLSMVEEEIDSLTADGAYDGAPTYEGRGGDRGRYRGDYSSSSIGSPEPCCRGPPFSARAAYSMREVIGRRRWQQFKGHTRRSRVETTMGRIPNRPLGSRAQPHASR